MNQAKLQSRVQLSTAVALCSLLVFVPQLSFSLACLAVVFIVLLRMMLSINNHVGTQLYAAAMLLGGVWVGVVAAGVIVSATTTTNRNRTQPTQPAQHCVVLLDR